ncbi:MAG: chemotaxis protein CheW [Pseudomonadota bacterium]
MPNTQVRCLLIPIGEEQLLLPSAVVAEVSPYNEPEQMSDNQHKWLLGIINWRNQRVPLLSIEEALSLPSATSVKKYRTVILYGLEFTQTMPFYAFISTEVPRTLTVTEESLTNPSANVRSGVVFQVKVDNTETAWLPDLTYLENLLR